jgi:hypothetical protein
LRFDPEIAALSSAKHTIAGFTHLPWLDQRATFATGSSSD